MFKTIRDDFQRHEGSLFNPAFWAIATYRFGNWSSELKFTPLRWFTSKIYGVLFFLVLLASGIRLHREARIGKNFHLVHSGNINIHPRSVIGDNVGIQHDVTIGVNMERVGVPVIGNDVYIGTGATILGPITIGDGARIAANSLVINDVPAGATAIGVPARVMKYTGRAAATKEKA